MKALSFCGVLVAAISMMACHQKKDNEEVQTKMEMVSFVSEAEPPAPPPTGLKSPFRSLEEWLTAICKGGKPEKKIQVYQFGLFESDAGYIMDFSGENTYEKGPNHSVTRIEFQPVHPFFPLPDKEYKDLEREKIWALLDTRLTRFTKTEVFRKSFLAKADAIRSVYGKVIWTNPGTNGSNERD